MLYCILGKVLIRDERLLGVVVVLCCVWDKGCHDMTRSPTMEVQVNRPINSQIQCSRVIAVPLTLHVHLRRRKKHISDDGVGKS